MSALRLQWKLVLAVLVFGSLTASGSAWAQTDEWSFLATPQLWFTHIEKNGFVAPSFGSAATLIRNSSGEITDANPFGARNSEPVDWGYPQWGIQLAAQKGRLTLAGAFQRVDFETRTDIISVHPTPFSSFLCQQLGPSCVNDIQPGQLLGQERLSSQRMDVDFAASYLFPDIVPGALDLSIGVGVKAIYAEATRKAENLSPALAFQSFFVPLALSPGTSGLYAVCSKDDLSNCRFKDNVHTTDWFYGLTIPTNMTVHLSGDGKWLLPLSITPFLGAETRNDHDVVYRLKQVSPTTTKADRLDGTTFAHGVTADVTLRYLITDALSVYAGGRVQYIKGHEQFLAYGPIVGMSVRFGGGR